MVVPKTLLFIISIFSLLIVPLAVSEAPQTDDRLLASQRAKAEILRSGSGQPQIIEHFGNPDRFIEYIISVPPVYA